MNPSKATPKYEPSPSAAISADAPSFPWFSIGGNRVRLLKDGSEAFPAILRAIAEAEREILIEMYWFASDRVGTIVRDALIGAAERGVVVRIIYDSFGSLQTSTSFWTPLLIHPNAEVRLFGSIAPWSPGFRLAQTMHRNHRKLIAIDGVRAFVGGLNIGNEWWPESGKPWRDDVLEVTGQVAGEVRAFFYRTWRRLGGAAPAGVRDVSRDGDGLVWLIANDRGLHSRRQIRRTYLEEIRNARRSIDIANAYFLPDPITYRSLTRAAARGVDVTVILPDKSDVPHMGLAQRALAPHMLRRGIHVYAYHPVVFHSKTAVIDDFVTIGSYNLDHRSWRANLECNLAIRNRDFANAVRKSIEDDLKNARPFSEENLRTASFARRTLGWLLLKCRSLL